MSFSRQWTKLWKLKFCMGTCSELLQAIALIVIDESSDLEYCMHGGERMRQLCLRKFEYS